MLHSLASFLRPRLLEIALPWRRRDDAEEMKELSEKLGKLKVLLEKIHLWIEEATDYQSPAATEIKQLAYDVEDVLDEFEYEVLRTEVEAGNRTRPPEYGDAREAILEPLVLDAGVRHKLMRRIDDVVARVDEFSDAALKLRGRASFQKRRRRRCEEEGTDDSFSDVRFSCGVERDVDVLVRLLLSDECLARDLSIVPLVGMGGVGKTTLARRVFEDPRVSNYFEL